MLCQARKEYLGEHGLDTGRKRQVVQLKLSADGPTRQTGAGRPTYWELEATTATEQIWRNTLYGDREGERPLVVAMPITLSDGAKRRRLSRALDEYYNPRTYGRT